MTSYWQWRNLLWKPFLVWLALLIPFVVFNFDHGLQQWLYNLPGLGFPFQESDAYEFWLHDNIKTASNSLALVLLGLIVWPRPIPRLGAYRIPFFLSLLAMLSAVALEARTVSR